MENENKNVVKVDYNGVHRMLDVTYSDGTTDYIYLAKEPHSVPEIIGLRDELDALSTRISMLEEGN